VVSARFEGDIEGGSPGLLPGLFEGNHLGMWMTGTYVGAFSNDRPGRVYNNGSHPRVGMSAMRSGELDGAPDVVGVAHLQT
jgi:hypothetical protein